MPARVPPPLFILLALAGCADNLAPVFDPPLGDRVVRVGQRAQFAVQAVDRSGGAVRYGALGLPPGASFDVHRRPPLFVWAPLASDGDPAGRPHPITFVATDEQGARTERRVVLTVFSGNSAPSFTSPSSYPLGPGEALDVRVRLRDDDSTRLHFQLVEAPQGAALYADDKSARLRWSPTPDQIARRRVWGFTVAVWDEDPRRSAQQIITVVVHD